MQQTPNYKLNLIETSDPFSPNALNENAQKLEAALSEETAARRSSDSALDARVKVLEAKKIVFGSYKANNSSQTIDLGFTPIALVVHRVRADSTILVFAPELATLDDGSSHYVSIVPNGFHLAMQGDTPSTYNHGADLYHFMAFA